MNVAVEHAEHANEHVRQLVYALAAGPDPTVDIDDLDALVDVAGLYATVGSLSMPSTGSRRPPTACSSTSSDSTGTSRATTPPSTSLSCSPERAPGSKPPPPRSTMPPATSTTATRRAPGYDQRSTREHRRSDGRG